MRKGGRIHELLRCLAEACAEALLRRHDHVALRDKQARRLQL